TPDVLAVCPLRYPNWQLETDNLELLSLKTITGKRITGNYKPSSQLPVLSFQSPLAVAGADTGTRARFQKRVSLSMRSLTCRMHWAAVPATPLRCGTW